MNKFLQAECLKKGICDEFTAGAGAPCKRNGGECPFYPILNTLGNGWKDVVDFNEFPGHIAQKKFPNPRHGGRLETAYWHYIRACAATGHNQLEFPKVFDEDPVIWKGIRKAERGPIYMEQL